MHLSRSGERRSLRAFAARGTVLSAGVVALAATAAWVLVLGPLQSSGMGGMQGTSMSIEAPLFMITWVVMLVAMMLPAVAPMVVVYQRITAARGNGLVMPAAFVLGYLIVWSAAGIVPLVFNLALPQVPMSIGMDGWSRLEAASLFTVGLYQLSPWKTACLKACRSPLGFFMAHDFGAGLVGAVRLGGLHGLICVGCCWALMALMVVAGSMSVAWMAALTLVFITEKVWRRGLALSRVVGAGALVASVAVVVMGWSL
jgi:Predicted metal-binding integral membrane protein